MLCRTEFETPFPLGHVRGKQKESSLLHTHQWMSTVKRESVSLNALAIHIQYLQYRFLFHISHWFSLSCYNWYISYSKCRVGEDYRNTVFYRRTYSISALFITQSYHVASEDSLQNVGRMDHFNDFLPFGNSAAPVLNHVNGIEKKNSSDILQNVFCVP